MTTFVEFEKSFNEVLSQMKEGYILAMMTDQFDIQRIENAVCDLEQFYQKGLEFRVFNRKKEVKWFRSSINKNFQYREIEDKDIVETIECNGKIYHMSYWDERQYLDIDTTVKLDGKVRATGGGTYPLPIPKEMYASAQVIVRNYLNYEEDTMQVYVSDWRLVDFVKEGDE